MKKFFILMLLANTHWINCMEHEPHPIIQALLQQSLKLVSMRRNVTGDFGCVDQKRSIFMHTTQSLYSLKMHHCESWNIIEKQTDFFDLSTTPFKQFLCIDKQNFEQTTLNSIQTITQFIATCRAMDCTPWWAKKSTIKEWRKNYQATFLKSLKKAERKEIKKLNSNKKKYAACFLHQLRENKSDIIKKIQISHTLSQQGNNA